MPQETFGARPGFGYVRTLSQQEELPLLRDHLLRLDPESRRDRFNGYIDDSYIERYAARCAANGTLVVAYMESGFVRGAAELHPPDQSEDGLPEVAFSVERVVRRQGIGSILFKRVISEARWKGYRRLRVTTGADNQAMRALAAKFGAQLVFLHSESSGIIEIESTPQIEIAKAAVEIPLVIARAIAGFNRACWKLLVRISGRAA